jgi:Peroxiredoxin
MIRSTIAFALMMSLIAGSAHAGEYNKKLSIGDAGPSFKNLPAADGKTYSMADFADKDVIVMAVTCNHCPVAVGYEDRMIEFAKKYVTTPDSKVALIAVSVSNSEVDRIPKMQERAKEKGFNYIYVHDESQTLGRDLGASVTPEFVVLNKDRKVVYLGAMDDNMKAPTVSYVGNAVDAALKGAEPEVKETRARGCGIGYKKN